MEIGGGGKASPLVIVKLQKEFEPRELAVCYAQDSVLCMSVRKRKHMCEKNKD
jgi:hypothetical protein